MTELNEQITAVTTPQEAVDQFVGEQFIEWLIDYVKHATGQWPVIKSLSENQVKPEKLKKFLFQRSLIAGAFLGTKENEPGFLKFAIANLSESSDPAAESALEILETKLNKGAINNQWIDLLTYVGASPDEINSVRSKEQARIYIAELSDVLSNSDWQTVVGAVACYEWSERAELKALANLGSHVNPTSGKEFKLSTEGPYEFAHILDNACFDPAANRLVWEGVIRELELKKELLDGLSTHLF